MSRRSLITRADAIDRDQRRRTMGAAMWSEAPVAPTAAAVWAGDGGGGWDPGWEDPLTSWVADLWAEVGWYVEGDPAMLTAMAQVWAEVGYELVAGNPLLESRGAQALAEVAHTAATGARTEAGVLAEVAHVEAAGQRQTVGLLAEVAVTGTLDPVVKPDGSYAAQTVAEVAVREQAGVRTEASVLAEVAFNESTGVRTEAGIIVEVAGT